MADPKNKQGRRTFLKRGGQAAAGVLAATVLTPRNAGAQTHAPPASATPRPRKKVIGGSPSPTYSRAVRFGDLIFIAGCVGVDAKGVIQNDFETQAGQTMLNLKESIERSGSSLGNVLKCTCFLKEVADFQTFNKVYLKFFPTNPPARSTVVVKDLVVKGAKLEVDCECAADIDRE